MRHSEYLIEYRKNISRHNVSHWKFTGLSVAVINDIDI